MRTHKATCDRCNKVEDCRPASFGPSLPRGWDTVLMAARTPPLQDVEVVPVGTPPRKHLDLCDKCHADWRREYGAAISRLMEYGT